MMNNDIEKLKRLNKELEQLQVDPYKVTTKSHSILPMEVISNTRTYIKDIAGQIEICYSNSAYDAFLVMVRRLMETLIIEMFLYRKAEQDIVDKAGNFRTYGDMVQIIKNKPGRYGLSRNTVSTLEKVKKLADKSAHQRTYIARKRDIDDMLHDIFAAVQDMLYAAGLNK